MMNAPTHPGLRVITLTLPTLNGVGHAFELLETRDMTLLRALKQIRGGLPATLLDTFVCHAGACNSCRVLIDGKPGLPCTTFTRDLASQATVEPGHHAQGWDMQRDDSRRMHGC
jgi:succinate dehydrogenase/fumarate reductase-like Fe-S protein